MMDIFHNFLTFLDQTINQQNYLSIISNGNGKVVADKTNVSERSVQWQLWSAHKLSWNNNE